MHHALQSHQILPPFGQQCCSRNAEFDKNYFRGEVETCEYWTRFESLWQVFFKASKETLTGEPRNMQMHQMPRRRQRPRPRSKDASIASPDKDRLIRSMASTMWQGLILIAWSHAIKFHTPRTSEQHNSQESRVTHKQRP